MRSIGLKTRIDVIDSHTAGEPTRLVVSGGPDLGSGSLAQRLERLRSQHDSFRSTVVNEPRGSDVLVGALLCEPEDRGCAVGVIFFNNVGYLGMGGHGTIGLVASLAHMGRIEAGTHRIETPVGIVTATLHESGEVSVQNVKSYRSRKNVIVTVANYGDVRGDVAWGGNWFYLIEGHSLSLTLKNVDHLTDFTWAVRSALAANGITGDNGGEIDHIELFGPASNGHADSRNFVLCPGKAYDRSPCGTGTSAKMACMAADGKLRPGQTWRQEGILGTVFEGSVELADGGVIPTITGDAYITAEGSLILDADDPFRLGIVS
jgi:4-hydroxyproline epimerase